MDKNGLIMQIYDVTTWEARNYNTYIFQYLKNQTIKFNELIWYKVKNVFLRKSCRKMMTENDVRRLVPDLVLFFFTKALYSVVVCNSVLIFFDSVRLGHWIKTNCTSRDMLSFDVLLKDLRTVSLPHSEYDFWGKMFLVFYSINWPNFLFWSL